MQHQPSAPPPTDSTSARSFLATIAAAALGCGIALAAAFGIWFVQQPNTDHLAEDTMSSLSDHIRTDEQLRLSGIKVHSVSVTHATGNLYEGQATIMDGTVEHMVPVHIVYDGDSLQWSTDPGAFLFTVR